MSKKLISISLAIVSGTALALAGASCSSSTDNGDGGGGGSSSSSSSGGSSSGSGSGSSSGGSSSGGSSSGSSSGSAEAGPTLVKLDDMEGTGNGPNSLPNVPTGESRGYWYNTASPGAPITPNPFAYTTLAAPHTTVTGVTSTKAAFTGCTLSTQYAYCVEGVDFFQAPIEAGLPADAGPEATVPQTTVASDISAYTGLTFWAMSGIDGGTVSVHTLFPDTDTDPRGGRCTPSPVATLGDGAASNYQCSDDFQHTDTFGATWTQVTISLAGCSTGALTCDLSQRNFGTVPAGTFFNPTQTYGVKWQSDGAQTVDAAPVVTGYFVDDVYFTK